MRCSTILAETAAALEHDETLPGGVPDPGQRTLDRPREGLEERPVVRPSNHGALGRGRSGVRRVSPVEVTRAIARASDREGWRECERRSSEEGHRENEPRRRPRSSVPFEGRRSREAAIRQDPRPWARHRVRNIR